MMKKTIFLVAIALSFCLPVVGYAAIQCAKLFSFNESQYRKNIQAKIAELSQTRGLELKIQLSGEEIGYVPIQPPKNILPELRKLEKEWKRIEGNAEAFAQTGTEGIIWSVARAVPILERQKGSDHYYYSYDNLITVNNGDILYIFNSDQTLYWSGKIKLEYKTNYRPYPMNPQFGQQAVLEMWVHGLQKSLDPEFWAQAFLQGKRVYLFKKKKIK